MARLEIDDVSYAIGGTHILRGVSLDVRDGECLALLGPSGCGKTTTLRAVAGFVQPTAGDIRVAGRSVLAQPAHRRGLGLVFQDYALFPHMTVAQNVGYGMRMRGVARAEVAAAVRRSLELVRLDGMDGRYATELSGGQRQRVALARALIIQPAILLLDEPLAALDRKLREGMQVELKRIQRETGITTIIVTHDQEEALSLADRVAVMFDGAIAELGEPSVIYQRPRLRTVMTFLGAANVFEGRVSSLVQGSATVACAEGVVLQCAAAGLAVNETVALGIRPEHVLLRMQPGTGAANDPALVGIVREIVYKGVTVDVYVALGGQVVTASLTGDAATGHGHPQVGQQVQLSFPAAHLVRLH